MRQAVVIRSATDEDAAALSVLIQRSVRISNAADYDAATIDAICRNFTPALVLEKMAQRDVFVADVAGVPCGTISLGGGKLHSLFVDPPQQRLGIGRLLTVYLEDHARAKGMTDEQHGELLAIIALAAKTNQLASALAVPVDAAFDRGQQN